MTLVLVMSFGWSLAQLEFDYSDYVAEYDAAFLAANPHTIHEIERDGFMLHAREFGNPDSPSFDADTTPVIALHGFPDNLHLFDGIVPFIAEERRIITFDHLGWGRSDKPVAAADPENPQTDEHIYDTGSLLRDLDVVVDYFGTEQVVLVAHDLSAFPVIDWSIANPDRVEHMVILNSVYFSSENLFPPQGIFIFGSQEARYSREYMVTIALQYPTFAQAMVEEQVGRFHSNDDAREIYTPLFVNFAPGILPAFFQMNSFLSAEVEARTIQFFQGGGSLAFDGPVTVIFGVDDPYLTEELSFEFGAAFPNSNVRNIENAGHYVQLDAP
ncbi:MAG: alpha/beta hydrolase, partial [Deinococcota bacterium]